MLENKKEMKETRNLLGRIIKENKMDFIKEIEPYVTAPCPKGQGF